MMNNEKEIYDEILTLKKGDEEQRRRAIQCEKILADECSESTLEEKIEKIRVLLSN